MRMAVVNLKTKAVVNFINAESWDTSPVGTRLVPVPDDEQVTFQHLWEPDAGFYPNADLQAELDAVEQAEEAEGLTFP